MKRSHELFISDHALIRYLERVWGVNVDKARKEMLSPDLRAAAAMGASSLCKNGMAYVIKGGRVVTVKPA